MRLKNNEGVSCWGIMIRCLSLNWHTLSEQFRYDQLLAILENKLKTMKGSNNLS